MKTLVNCITFVFKCSLSVTLTYFFFFRNSLQQNRKIPLHIIGELNHPISLLFFMKYIFLMVYFIGKCFTTWGWRKSELPLFAWTFFGWWFSNRCFSVFFLTQEVFFYFFNPFDFSKTLNGLSPGASFYTLEIFLYLWHSLFLEVTYHVSNSLLGQSKNTYNYTLWWTR